MQHPSIAPYGAYTAVDSRDLVAALQNDREWSRLCTIVLGRSDLVDDPRFRTNNARVTHRSEMDAVLRERFGEMDLDTLKTALDRAGSPMVR